MARKAGRNDYIIALLTSKTNQSKTKRLIQQQLSAWGTKHCGIPEPGTHAVINLCSDRNGQMTALSLEHQSETHLRPLRNGKQTIKLLKNDGAFCLKRKYVHFLHVQAVITSPRTASESRGERCKSAPPRCLQWCADTAQAFERFSHLKI